MKKIFHKLTNISASEGTYLLKGEYKTLPGNSSIVLEVEPTNSTANISVVRFKRDDGRKTRQENQNTAKQENQGAKESASKAEKSGTLV